MKINLTDLTFLILVRLDSIQRLENIKMVTDSLLKYFDTNIYVLEADVYNNDILKNQLNRKIRYQFMEDKDPILHKTRYEPFSIEPDEVPGDCIITTDRRYLSTTDAVVFHMPTLHRDLEDDLDKPEGQIWVAWSLECEENYPFLKDPELMELFDLRMSYHSDADIVYPYYEYDFLTELSRPACFNKKQNKTCMPVSSPFNKSNRREYLWELMQYTPIDSYGKLFNTKKLIDDKGRETKMELYAGYIQMEKSAFVTIIPEKNDRTKK
ncbi:hypothetical protein FACS1894155_12040 [Bacteroidia bacterium]|nr:hypothetical protein FACS1894155_12040 [Bacteroidia bacterium]